MSQQFKAKSDEIIAAVRAGATIEDAARNVDTDAQIQKLGEEGKALKKPGGGYHYPIVDGRDVSNAVKAFGRAKPSERAGVRAWIVKRARILAVEGRLPESWSVKSPTPAAVGTESGS